MQPYKERAVPKDWQRRLQKLVQQGFRIGTKLLQLVKKVSKAPIIQKIGKMEKKVKAKKLRKLFQHDFAIANSLVDMGTEYGWQKLG